MTHSWELDRRIIESVGIPAIIAGGLGPENVQEAIRFARSAGVDSKNQNRQKRRDSHKRSEESVGVRNGSP